mmetsp:Transcript_61343/g.138441  ORF Transcript_61343/g.138441 Transcript_61343/m.138441 type:complete len:336 (-) Transcript_61343:106-1113(-)
MLTASSTSQNRDLSCEGRSSDGSSKKLALLDPESPFDVVSDLTLIGRGSFGRVYHGHWGSTPVAVKVLPYRLGDVKEERVRAEAEFSLSLSHPNLVSTFLSSCRVISESSDNGKCVAETFCEMWLVQEFCNMGTLMQRLIQDDGLAFLTSDSSAPDVPQIVDVLLDIVGAMVYVHARGLVHADLYDSNVLLTSMSSQKGYTCKVADFGKTRILNFAAGQWEHRTDSMGCVTHMPPELFVLQGAKVTKAVDVYSFGVIIWQLFALSIPFSGFSPQQVAVSVGRGKRLQAPSSLQGSTVEIRKLKQLFEECVSVVVEKRPMFSQVQSILMQMQPCLS